MTQEIFRVDFIEHYPLLEDGSSSCKLPALLIDNGAFNFIFNNQLIKNYGGGFMMVRTGVGKFFFDNVIIDNVLGRNKHFSHFSGILYLGMGVGFTEFSMTEAKLDFLPSEINFFRNTIRVGEPDRCIVYDKISANNAELDNIEMSPLV